MMSVSTIEQLKAMKFSAMAKAFQEQMNDPKTFSALGFEERFGLMVSRSILHILFLSNAAKALTTRLFSGTNSNDYVFYRKRKQISIVTYYWDTANARVGVTVSTYGLVNISVFI